MVVEIPVPPPNQASIRRLIYGHSGDNNTSSGFVAGGGSNDNDFNNHNRRAHMAWVASRLGMQQRATDPWKISTYDTKDYSSMEGQDNKADASPISSSIAVMRNTASPTMLDNSPNNKSPNGYYHSEGIMIPDEEAAIKATLQQTEGRASPEEAADITGRPVGRNTNRHSEEFGFQAIGIRDKFREPSGLEQKIQKLRAEKEACFSHERFNEGRDNGYPATKLPTSSSFQDHKMRQGDPSDDEMIVTKEEFLEGDREREPSPVNQDTPLDFSVKRRPPSASGSMTDDSRASSSSPSHGKADYRGGGSPEPLALSRNVNIKEESDFGNFVSTENHPHYINGLHVNGYSGGAPCSPESQGLRNVKAELAESIAMEEADDVKVKSEPENDNVFPQKQPTTGGAPMPTPLLNGLGGLFPGLGPNLLAPGKSAIGSFSQMAAAAAFMDPRLNASGMNSSNTNNSAISSTTANNANKKLTRPFKAYPKEALQMPLGGFLGAPGLTPALLQQGMETGMFAGMNTEDLMALYNQQLQLFREKQVSSSSSSSSSSSLSQSGQKTNISPTASPNTINANVSHPSPPHNPNINNNSSNHYLHFGPSSPSPNNKILSSRQHKTNGGSPPVEYTSGSTNGSVNNNFPASALVSSTSSSPSSSTTNHHHSNSNSNSRKRARALPDEQKDAAYWERRRKNNDAAKRSRDARRAKEDEIALRAALLEQENIKLRVEVASLKTETSRLRCLLYNS